MSRFAKQSKVILFKENQRHREVCPNLQVFFLKPSIPSESVEHTMFATRISTDRISAQGNIQKTKLFPKKVV